MAESEPGSSPAGVPLAPGVWAPAGAVRWQFSRSSGPGGQNVNKVNTRAEVWVAVSALVGLGPRALERLRAAAGPARLTAGDELHLSSDAERSQEANRAAVLGKLRGLLTAAAHAPKARRKTKPTKASARRRLESKRRRSDVKSGRRTVE